MHNFHWKGWDITATYFQKIAIYNDEWEISWQFYLLKLKNKKCRNIIRLSHSFVFSEGQMPQYYSAVLMLQPLSQKGLITDTYRDRIMQCVCFGNVNFLFQFHWVTNWLFKRSRSNSSLWW